MEKKTYYLSELQRGAREELEERIKEEEVKMMDSDIIKPTNEWGIFYGIELDDLIAEVSDNNIPIYTYDLLQYASNNFNLIYKNDLCSDDADCIQIIQSNIYELLMEDLYEYLNERKGE